MSQNLLLLDAMVSARKADDLRRAGDGTALRALLTARQRAIREERERGEPLDPFEVFGRLHAETTHSSVLGWLLDERGSHGLGRAFAEGFFELIAWQLPPERYTTALERQGPEAKVDVVVEGDSFILGIENKVWATEGRDQTPREWRDLQKIAGGRMSRLVFLSPSGERPREPNATPLAWPGMMPLLQRLGGAAPTGTRAWLEGIHHHIDRVFRQGGQPMRCEFREDAKQLIRHWREYQELQDSFARAEADLHAIQQGIAMRLLRRPWAAGSWKHNAKEGVLLRKLGWGDDVDRVRIGVMTLGLENILGESSDGERWWSAVQVKGSRIDQAKVSAALHARAQALGTAADWQFQATSKDGAVMWRYLEPLAADELAGDGLTRAIEREMDQLAAFVDTIDACVVRPGR